VTDGAKEMPLHAARGDLERLGHLVGRPLLYLAKDEDLLLAAGQGPKRAPQAIAELGVNRQAIGVPRLSRELEPVDRVRAPPEPPPPAGAASIAAGVDRHSGEPAVPVVRWIERASDLDSLQEHLLDDLVGLVAIRQKQPTEAT
jgi:hypothetical protein